jgi:NAD(P)-dependent dehydrogenase (short-subunit alcohol dehydrogenase family)
MKTLLKDKVAIITGSASGIGKAAALLFAEEGAKVVVSDVNEKDGQAVADEIIQSGGKAIFVKCDTSKPAENEMLVKKALDAFGALHIAVNNAGVGGDLAQLVDYTIEGWQKVIDINLSGVFYGMKYQIPAMLKSGGGSIVNISSILGSVAFPNAPAYTAAKHGVVGLSQQAALDYSAKGIRINSVGPAFIRTPMISALPKEAEGQLIAAHPIGRLGEPIEVAELIAFLSSDRASFLTGNYYPVDGGYLAQ